MSAPETGDTNFVDLTLDERFGYTRKTPYHHQVDNTRVKSEDVNTVQENGRRESCWEEIEWHKRHREEPQDMGEDFTDDGKLFTLFLKSLCTLLVVIMFSGIVCSA